MTTATVPVRDTGRGPGLASLLEVIGRRRRLALLPVLFVVAAAASLAWFLPDLWTGRAVILVDRQQIPESFVKPTVTGDLEVQLLTLSQEILNRPRLGRIVEQHGLYPRLRATRSMDEVVERMRRDIRVEYQGDEGRRGGRASRTVAFAVGYTTTDPRVAAAVANQLAALYVAENDRYRERQAVGTSEFLEAQLREVSQRLQEQERRIAAFKEGHLGELPEQKEANLRVLERLQAQLQLAHETSRRALERQQLITRSLAEIDMSTALPPTGAAGGPDISPAAAAAGRLALLRQELVQLQARFSDRYPDVVHLKEQIRALEAKVEAEKKAAAAAAAAAAAPAPAGKETEGLRPAPANPYVVSLLQQLDQARVEAATTTEEIAGLNRRIAEYQRRIENTPRREQELAQITRDYETTRELFRSLQAKRGEAGMAADLEQRQKGERFRIIEPAAAPDRPTGPNRARLILLGLLAGLAAGVVAVVVAEQADRSYRSADEVRASVPVPVLSVIPRITTDRDRARQAWRRGLAAAAVAVGLVMVVGSTFAVARHNESLVALLSAPELTPVRR